jgi:hypothetical protein
VIQPAPDAVRDTLAAVFRQPAFERSLRETLWRRLLNWFGGLFDRLNAAVAESPVALWTARVLLAAAIALVVGRAAFLLWAWWRERERVATLGPSARRAAGDPWLRAQAAAAAGDYTAAAHLLYQALLQLLAGRERLRLHASKTVGDYARELRARSSSAFPAFRDFARDYEIVVYDLQTCDRERYERLQSLAGPLVGPAAGARGG